MSYVQLHLMTVHVPVIGMLFISILLLLANLLQSDLLLKITLGLFLGTSLFTGIAYFSGPYAYGYLEKTLILDDISQSKPVSPQAKITVTAENHAVLGRSAALVNVVAFVVAISMLLQYPQGEKPSTHHRWILFVTLLLLTYFFAWSAHLGGKIRRPDMQSYQLYIFPEMPAF